MSRNKTKEKRPSSVKKAKAQKAPPRKTPTKKTGAKRPTGDSRSLKNHVAAYPLRADRAYVAFEEGALKSELALALKLLAKSVLASGGHVAVLVERAAQQLELTYDSAKFDELREAARQEAWRTLRTSKEDLGAFALTLCYFLSGGAYVIPRRPMKG